MPGLPQPSENSLAHIVSMAALTIDKSLEEQLASRNLKMLTAETTCFPFIETRLGLLPEEIRKEILGHLLDYDVQVDITIPANKNGMPRLRFQRWFPHLKEAFRTVLFTCHQLREEGIRHLGTETLFINRLSSSALNLPTVFGPEATAMIKRLDMNIHFRQKTLHERTWPPLLELLTDKMPSLKRFRLMSEYASNCQPFPQHESGDPVGVTRGGQEIRALLRFGVFMTLRHPNLDQLVLPAVSGTILRDDRETASITKCFIVVEVMSSKINRSWDATTRRIPGYYHQAVRSVDAKGILMNCTAIRRLKWTELAYRDPESLGLSTTSTKSEVPEDHDFFRMVDRMGYLTFEELQSQGLGRRKTVDNLIDLGRDEETRTSQPDAPKRGAHISRGARGGGFKGEFGQGRGGRGRGAPASTNDYGGGPRGGAGRGNRVSGNDRARGHGSALGGGINGNWRG